MHSQWPEESWERLGSQLLFEVADLQLILEHALGHNDIVGANLLEGGKCNTNYAVALSTGERVVVRIYERDFEGSKRDEVIFGLADGQIPCPKMLGAIHDSSDLPESLVSRLNGRPIGVFECIEGVKAFDIFREFGPDSIPEVAVALGQTLAKIGPLKQFEAHGLLDAELNFKRRFKTNQISFVDFISWSVEEGRAGERLGVELADRVAEFADENAHILDVTESAYGLVHGDYKLSNILMNQTSKGWEVAAILDWEFAFAGSPLADAAILLRHAAVWPGFEDAFARGFTCAGGELPENWRSITRLLDLMNLCGFLNGSQHREKTYVAVKNLISRTIQRP